MGLPTTEREFLRAAFAAAFALDKIPTPLGGGGDVSPTVAIVDFMQYVKYIPPDIATKSAVLQYFVSKISHLMLNKHRSTLTTMIVVVDGEPLDVKRMIEHKKRYKNVSVYKSEGGKKRYLPRNSEDLMPREWIRFAGSYKLLRRELYPELFNAFITCRYFTPLPGQTLILSGFPGRSRWETVYNNHLGGGTTPSGVSPWDARTSTEGQVLVVAPWTDLPITRTMEQEDPDLYNRVYYVKNIPPCQQYPKGALERAEWKEACASNVPGTFGANGLAEADVRLFYYDHWFQNEHIIFYINDGDVFSIGLLYASERCTAISPHTGQYVFRNQHTVCLPYKKGKKKKKGVAEKEVPAAPAAGKEEYVNLNILYQLVRSYPQLQGVQNPVASFVFLLIMAETDFFKDFLKGMGAQKVIWKVFFENAQLLSHLVQLSDDGVPRSTRTPRTAIMDEDMFRQFIYYCYLEKHKNSVGGRPTFSELQKATQVDAKGKPKADEAYYLPDRNRIRLWCRQVEWNLLYWKNGPLGHFPNPFEMWYDLPYYPYWKDPAGKPVMVDVVATRPKPVDWVYAQHMYAHRKRPTAAAARGGKGGGGGKKRARVAEEIQKRVLDEFEHHVKE
jgi:hypothetical protein